MAYIALPITWLTCTTSGLNAALTITTMFSPVQFSYSELSGKIIGQPIIIRDLAVDYQGKVLKIGHLSLDWQLRSINAKQLHGIDKFLPQAELLKYQSIELDHLYAHTSMLNKTLNIYIQAIGQSSQTPLVSSIRLQRVDNVWDVKHALLQVGKNNIDLTQNSNAQYQWNLNIRDPQAIFTQSSGNIIAYGGIQNMHSTPTVNAKIHANSFTINDYQVRNLQALLKLRIEPTTPLIADITAEQLVIAQHHIENLQIKLNGDIGKHIITSKALFNKEIVLLNAEGNYAQKVWTLPKILIGYKQESLNGKAHYNFGAHTGKAELHGKLFTFNTTATISSNNLRSAYLQLKMYSNLQNNLSANISITNYKLDGQVKIIADDLAFLMQWMPDVTRLKGKFDSLVNIAGTLEQPAITSETHLTEITATVPVLGIKIKPMEVHALGDKNGKFTVTGKGAMRRGTGDFNFSGYIEPFKNDLPNAFTFVGSNLEFVNNQLAHLTASNNFKIHFAAAQKRLDITGNIEVHKGNITIADKRTQTVKSKDIVFVNEEVELVPKNLIVLNPDINIRISEGVHFSGFGLHADVTGKLNISHRHDALYADGRVTIKEGSFQLPGQKLTINRGRLLYPPGTLLANPVLDIKMIDKIQGQSSEKSAEHNLEVSVQGTAQKPVISESGLAGNKDRAISQALLTGSSIISHNLLQDKLKISEIGLAQQDTHEIEFFDDPSKYKNSFRYKDFVLGRSLSRKVYIQYLHSMGEANKRVRLKYFLNNIWAIGIESGTQGGGADLSFTIERD